MGVYGCLNSCLPSFFGVWVLFGRQTALFFDCFLEFLEVLDYVLECWNFLRNCWCFIVDNIIGGKRFKYLFS